MTWRHKEPRQLTDIGMPIGEIRRSYGRLICTIGFSILVKGHFYVEYCPWSSLWNMDNFSDCLLRCDTCNFSADIYRTNWVSGQRQGYVGKQEGISTPYDELAITVRSSEDCVLHCQVDSRCESVLVHHDLVFADHSYEGNILNCHLLYFN